MAVEWPDSLATAEFTELNASFLELLRRSHEPTPVLGLDVAIRLRLQALDGAALEFLATIPCLLATIPWPRWLAMPAGVADGPAPGRGPLGRTPDPATTVFAAGLVGYLWHAARRDALHAALCLGPVAGDIERFGGASFREIQRLSRDAGQLVEARFCRNSRLWPDLIRAATSRDEELRQATRLSMVQQCLLARSLEPASRSGQQVAPSVPGR